MKFKGWVAAFFVVLMLPLAWADTNYNNTALTISSNTNLSGYHYNISEFTVQQGVTVTIDAYNGSDRGWLKINASKIYIYGTIVGDGSGYGGGGGGGGGGSEDDSAPGTGTGGAGGSGGQGGSSGSTGTNEDNANLFGDPGGAGGAGFSSVSGGAGGLELSGNDADDHGDEGTNAPANNDTTVAINASIGYGGGGGGGGAGADNTGDFEAGPGGAGGGAGGDGGAYLILIGRNKIVANGTFALRAGQTTCSDAAGGSASLSINGRTGGSSASAGCTSGAGGSGDAPHPDWHDGGYGGNGGYGAGGTVVLASYEVNLAGANATVDGGSASNGGTIKVLYTNSVTNGTYESGYSSLVVSNFTNGWFEADIADEESGRESILAGAESSEIGASYTANTDRRIQIRLLNGTQYSAVFDVLIASGSKRWAFNYNQSNTTSFQAFANITPTFYVWQRSYLQPTALEADVAAFLNQTYP